MPTLRKNLCWIFALAAFVYLQIAVSGILRTTHRPHAFLSLRNLLVPVLYTAFAVVFGLASWTVWKGRPSARGWGIAASLINILVSLTPVILAIIFSPRSVWGHSAVARSVWESFALVFGFGVAGLVAFWRAYEQPGSKASSQENLRIPGDGTSDLANKTVGILIFAAYFGAYAWWIRWLRARGVSGNEGSSHGGLIGLLVLSLIVTTLHELGHTVTGLALGMRLRAFIVGPFQWRIREGKWKFQFNPREILSAGGATGVVPATADFPRWRDLCMLAAGPFVNLVTGIFALWIAFTAQSNSYIQAGGSLALFGAWSLIIGSANLLPFRTRDQYSDGAQISQLLSNGPWGDWHRVLAVIGSSLVTPLRPRNYDIDAIQRAARGIAQGKQGLLLRLWAYSYFLDLERIPEAGEMLRQAESIYHQSASDIPAELHSEFVFGNAYVLRDADAAREWWTRMEAKKPTRLNVDYWRAASALHWIEGDLQQANEEWEKSNALAEQLPKAGAYEFDRYCCCKLRQALDEVPALAG